MKRLCLIQPIRRYATSLKPGDTFSTIKIISQTDLDNFSNITGDHNPIHKVSTSNDCSIVHGAFLNGIVSGMIGTKLPGAGSIVLSQNFSFPNKCYVDKEIECTVRMQEIRKILKVEYECTQDGITVFKGDAKLILSK